MTALIEMEMKKDQQIDSIGEMSLKSRSDFK